MAALRRLTESRLTVLSGELTSMTKSDSSSLYTHTQPSLTKSDSSSLVALAYTIAY